MAEGNLQPNQLPSLRKERNVKQRVGPISYHLYSLFMNCLLHKKIPDEQVLIEAGMKTSVDDADGTNRRQKFLAWSKKMAVRVNPHPVTPDVQVVSLISKKTNKEIVPKEHFRHLIREIHTRNGRPGQNHLPIHSTVSEIKHKFTFGRRDFGMCEELVRDVINECDALHCYAKIYCKTYKKPDGEGTATCGEPLLSIMPRTISAGRYDPSSEIIGTSENDKTASEKSSSGTAATVFAEGDGAQANKKDPELNSFHQRETAAASCLQAVAIASTTLSTCRRFGESDSCTAASRPPEAPRSGVAGAKRKCDDNAENDSAKRPPAPLDQRTNAGMIAPSAVPSAADGTATKDNSIIPATTAPKLHIVSGDSDFRDTYLRLLSSLSGLRQELLRTACGHPLAYDRFCQSFTATEDLVRLCKDELTKFGSGTIKREAS